MTQRNRAENVSEEELKKLVFVPFANTLPGVRTLGRTSRPFSRSSRAGPRGYTFNSTGFWRHSSEDVNRIPLRYSLALQSAILLDQIEWMDWDYLPGSQVPEPESVEKLLPGYYAIYDPKKVKNRQFYLETLKDRFEATPALSGKHRPGAKTRTAGPAGAQSRGFAYDLLRISRSYAMRVFVKSLFVAMVALQMIASVTEVFSRKHKKHRQQGIRILRALE